jgi:hypothetical protein
LGQAGSSKAFVFENEAKNFREFGAVLWQRCRRYGPKTKLFFDSDFQKRPFFLP